MKLIVIIMTTCLVQVSAAGFAQKLNFTKRGASLSQIFTEIRKQTGYFVIYSDQQIDDAAKLDVNFKNTDLKDVMDVIGKSQSLDYSFAERNISLKPKEKGFLDNIIARFQAIDVRGKVVDSVGNGLAGATVSVKNGKGSTSTDAGGNFYLKNVDEGAMLVVNYLGYITKEVAVNKEFMNVVLQQSESKLDEVQIMAYGTTSQRLNTGNIVSIKAADIEKQPVNNPLYALQGRVAGLQITPTTGLSGGAVNVQIRGKNSLNFQTEPLIVVDGLPIVNNITGLGHTNLQQLSALSFITPGEIESIDVLKDADATSIYGSRGANGVILITTKKGKIGEARININAQTGYGEVSKKLKLMNTSEYLDLRREAFLNSGVNLSTATVTRSRADVLFWDQNRYTDWQDKLIGGKALYHDVQGSFSGGSSIIQYLLGGNYHKETTVFSGNNSDQKGSSHLSLIGTSPNQKFQTFISVKYLIDNNTLPGIDFTNAAVTLPPNAPELYNVDGSLNWELLPSGAISWDNPYASFSQIYEAKINNLIANADINYKLFPFLTLKTQFGYNDLKGESFRAYSPFAGRPPGDLGEIAGAAFNTNYVRNLSLEPQISFKKVLFRGDLDALIGSSIQNTIQGDQLIDAVGFTSDALLRNLAAADPNQTRVSNSSSQYKYAAIFGRLKYDWDNKYIVNFSFRRDGSSRFGPGNQFGNFASIGAAWIFTQEKFSTSILPVMSYGKLRFSYGSSGNDGIGDYQYLERYTPVNVNDRYQGATGYKSSGLFNSYYAWESTKKLEFALETGFFKDRLLLTGVYFQNRSGNQLQNYPFASMVGPGSPVYNLAAVVQNSGLEVTLSSKNIDTKSFTWNTAINFTQNRNKLISYPDIENSAYYLSTVGRPFYGEVNAFKSAGVDQQTGKYQFTKMDGSVTFDPTEVDRLDNGQYLRLFALPKFYGGISNSFTFSGFSLDVFFQFSKQTGTNPILRYIGTAGSQSNLPVEFVDRWRKQGDISDIQKVYTSRPSDYVSAANRLLASDVRLVDASFIRLKNLSFSYSIPNKWKYKIGSKDLKIYLQGQNLWTITRYKGLDPETQSSNVLPPLRVLTTGINLMF